MIIFLLFWPRKKKGIKRIGHDLQYNCTLIYNYLVPIIIVGLGGN